MECSIKSNIVKTLGICINSVISPTGNLFKTNKFGRTIKYLLYTLLTLPAVGSTHHSRAEFSNEIEEIEGQIVEIAWRNPHPVLTLNVSNDAGESELWEVESWSAVNQLVRKGVVGDLFQIGQTVRAAVRPSNRRPGTLLGESISLGDGTQAVLRPGSDPVFPDEAVIGINAVAEPNNPTNENGQDMGLFRVWSLADREGPGELPLTPAALAKQESFDELADHPMWNCDPVGMPVIMDTTLPVEFIDEGQQIHMRIEQSDGLRIIDMQPANNELTISNSIMGHSVGKWENNTLIVITTKSSYPYLDDNGTAKSENMRIDERFTLGSDGNTLLWEATLTDPVYLEQPISMRMNWEWVSGEIIRPWDCLESSSGREP
tara:strand:- start:387 stop:1511 length:1125 start_codon:yes stop_codon:yes gene_type:complete